MLRPPQKRGNVATKILDIMEMALKVICVCLLSVIVACLSYAVVMRYVFHQPPAWSMELSRFLFLWMVIFGAILVTREQSHIQITFLVNFLPPKVRLIWLNVLRMLMIGFCWVMIQQGLAIYPLVSEALSPTLRISMGWFYLTIPVCGLFMGIYIAEAIIVSILEFRKTDSLEEKLAC